MKWNNNCNVCLLYTSGEVVLDNKILTSDDNDINYDSESIVGVKNNVETYNEVSECSDNEMLMCIDEVEREWKNSIFFQR